MTVKAEVLKEDNGLQLIKYTEDSKFLSFTVIEPPFQGEDYDTLAEAENDFYTMINERI